MNKIMYIDEKNNIKKEITKDEFIMMLHERIIKAKSFLKEVEEELKSSKYENDKFYANEHIENINIVLKILKGEE